MHYRDEPFKLSVRHAEKKELKNKLKSKSTPEVIPVVGVGGIGKRALLRHAYEPETFKDYFNVRIRVSFPPDVDESSMVRQVEEALERKRSLYKQQATMQQGCYLVVIESPVNTATWSKLEPRLLEMAKKACSKILVPVTSSPDDVKGSSIKMKALVERHSKTLFNQVYGLNGRRGTNYQKEEMDKIRKNIMRITGGHPFAVVLVAKLMRTMDLSKWEAAAEYMMSSNEDSKLQTILSVCVDDLPDELKSCLLFTAGFPESRKIDAQQLVRLWMAEGFLTHHHGLETERLGQCYLKELIHRGLFQLVSKTSAHGDGDGCVEWVAIHDQIHPLLRSEAQRTSFMDVHYGGCIPAPGNARRLALLNYNHNFDALSNGLGKLRTVVSYSDDHKGSSKREDQRQSSRKEPTLKMRELLQGSPYLRVIDLEGIDVGSELPDCTGEMVLLQYLGVRSQKLEKLPSSVENLRQLQTIDVRDSKVRELPKQLWKIKTLRHVLGDRLAFPWSTGSDLKLMQTLETVTIKTVTTKRGKKLGLRSLQRLRVVELDGSQGEALETVLEGLSSLHSLSLSGDVIPINNFLAGTSSSYLGHVVSLELDGKLPDIASNDSLWNRLTHLVLRSTNIKQDFIIHVISKLSALTELALHGGSYADGELDLCTDRFRSLTVLEVSELPTLKKIFVPGGRNPIKPTLDMPYQVQVRTHKPCDYCPREEVGQQQASAAQNNQENGGNSHTTEEDANQSPLPSFPKMILEAIDNNKLSIKAIEKHMKKFCGESVQKHLDHMVEFGNLQIKGHGSHAKYFRPKTLVQAVVRTACTTYSSTSGS